MHEIAYKNDIPSELTVEIEKLSNLGYGIARVDGYVFFVENACPEDIVKIRLTKKNKNYANAQIVEIIKQSPYRILPFCRMQKVCGACQLQFIDYNYQLKLKKEIVVDLMRGLGDIEIKDIISSPKIKEYRHKIQYPISETKNSKRILAGYYKQNSHEIVNIKYCPIQPEYCDRIIEFIRETAPKCGVSGYNEKHNSGDLRHVVIRTSDYSKENLVVLVINSDKISENINGLAGKIYSELNNIAGVCVNLNPKKTNLILGEKTVLVKGKSYLEEKLTDKIFKVGAETFFQVNPYTANNIFEFIKKYISENFDSPSVLDTYAGIAAFGICLSDVSKSVVSVEDVKASTDLAKQIIEENGIKNVEVINSDADKFFKNETRKFDVTLLDPPRKGCSETALDNALKLTTGKIIYVSCNPATLARDLKYLLSKGCKVEFIQPFDMFPHTYHIESVAIISIQQ